MAETVRNTPSDGGICRIVGAGQGFPSFAPIKKADGDLLIAADGGLAALEKLGIVPDVILGDFDSLGYAPTGDNVIRHPVEKDDTDMMLAIRLGLERGYRRFYLYGGAGGRLDHTLANLQALAFLATRGAAGYLFTDTETLTVIRNGALHFAPQAAGLLSVFAMGGPANGVSITGLQYQLQNGTLTPDRPLGVSNHFVGQKATVSVTTGMLLVGWDGQMLPEHE